jgi:CubicO group peptidase (beta-lactamase class C family)
VTAALVVVLAGSMRIPVPDGTPAGGNAAATLRASAGDLARFLLEVAHPTLLPPGLDTDMTSAQVRLDDQVAWGLGIGLQTTPGARAVFHWGRNPAVRAAMVLYLDRGDGVVVLSNDGQAGDVVEAIALRAVGGPRYWADY